MASIQRRGEGYRVRIRRVGYPTFGEELRLTIWAKRSPHGEEEDEPCASGRVLIPSPA